MNRSLRVLAEAVTSYFGAVGIRVTIRPMERGAFFKEYQEKRLKQIIQSTSAAFGNAATRLDAFVAASGLFTYGTYPEIEDLVRRQAMEMDRGKREMYRRHAERAGCRRRRAAQAVAAT